MDPDSLQIGFLAVSVVNVSKPLDRDQTIHVVISTNSKPGISTVLQWSYIHAFLLTKIQSPSYVAPTLQIKYVSGV